MKKTSRLDRIATAAISIRAVSVRAVSVRKEAKSGTLRRHLGLAGSSALLGLLSVHSARAQDDQQPTLQSLKAQIMAQEAQLQKEEVQIEAESLKLGEAQILLDNEMRTLHGRGPGTTAVQPAAQAAAMATQAAQPQPQAQASGQSGQTSIAGPTPSEQQTKAIVQTDTALSNAGGVLTPKGSIVLDPSLEYDYYQQNQLAVNGFTVIPGITLGNIYVERVAQNIGTLALTTRYGVTNRLELNLKLPVVAEYGLTTTQQVGPGAQTLTPGAQNFNIGDIQVGASYQFNRDDTGWPIFVGNLLFKTKTGVSPYSVPIYTVNDPNGQYLAGIEKKLPTGTGFYSLEPSVTILYPTDPGVLFANVQYIYNFSSTVDLKNPGGGASTPTDLQAGQALAATFGLGFALNEHTSMTLSYEHEHVFGASQGGAAIKGSAYDFGNFNFGIGYQVNRRVSVNLGVGVGAGPNAPVAKILLEVPVTFNVL